MAADYVIVSLVFSLIRHLFQNRKASICDFGNQVLVGSAEFSGALSSDSYFGIPTGVRYIQAGHEYVTLDTNGFNGAWPIDLAVPFGWLANSSIKLDYRSRRHVIAGSRLLGSADVVLNIGTLEHVGGAGFYERRKVNVSWNDLHSAFQNMHNIVRPGGIMVHDMPQAECDVEHGEFAFHTSFFSQLAQAAGYKVHVLTTRFIQWQYSRLDQELETKILQDFRTPLPSRPRPDGCQVSRRLGLFPLVTAVFVKPRNSPFIDATRFSQLPGVFCARCARKCKTTDKFCRHPAIAACAEDVWKDCLATD